MQRRLTDEGAGRSDDRQAGDRDQRRDDDGRQSETAHGSSIASRVRSG